MQIVPPNGIVCAGNGCFVQTNFQKFNVRGPYSEFVSTYAPVRRYGAEEMRLVTNAGINQLDGTPLLVGAPASYPQAFRVTVYAKEVLTADGVYATDAELGAGRDISVLKARVTWHMFAQIPRVIDLDIGTGFDICVGPTDQVQIDVLAPVITTATRAALVVPTDHVYASYNTAVQAVVMCDPGTGPNFIGRYTQSVFVRTGTAAATMRVALKPEARFVQILSDSTGNPPPHFRILYDFNPTASPDLGVVDWDAARFSTDKFEIPQGASHLEFAAAPANLTGSSITVVQELFR